MDWLLSIFSSSGLGAIVGAIGAYLTRKAELAKMKADFEFKLKNRELDLQEASSERSHELQMADKQMQRAKVEGDVAEQQVEAEAFKESIMQAGKRVGITFVDAIKSLMRPTITAYLLVNTTILAVAVGDLLGGLESIPVQELSELYKTIITQVIGLTALAVSWWFGSRPARS